MSPESVTQANESSRLDRRRATTRREIAESAVALFREDGYDAVSVEAIARHAGLSLRSFYRYFTAKEDVLDPLLTDGTIDFVRAFSERPASEELLVAAVEAYHETAGPPENDAFATSLVHMLSQVPALRGRWLDGLRAAEELLIPHIRARLPATASELDVRGRAAMIVLALRLPLELSVTDDLTGSMRETHEEVLRRLTDGSFTGSFATKTAR